jgi:hypothetical protein
LQLVDSEKEALAFRYSAIDALVAIGPDAKRELRAYQKRRARDDSISFHISGAIETSEANPGRGKRKTSDP